MTEQRRGDIAVAKRPAKLKVTLTCRFVDLNKIVDAEVKIVRRGFLCAVLHNFGG